MTDLNTIASRHADQVREAVAGARLPQLEPGRGGVRALPRPAWALFALLVVVLAFSLPFVLGSDHPDLEEPVVATTALGPDAETSTVSVGPDGGFTPTGTLSRGCAWCQGVLLADGRVLAIGGAWAEIYDPATWTFTLLEAGPSQRVPAPPRDAALLGDGRVLIVVQANSHEAPTILDIFDPATNTFRSIERPRGQEIAVVGLLDGRALILGHRGARPDPVIFDPVTERFTDTGPATAANHADAILLDDGRVLVLSEWGEAELYDPASNTFTPTGRMITARHGPTVTKLGDGRVLVAGGSGQGTQALGSAELYDPKTGTFTPTGSMATVRSSHAAALLPDGRVLVIGGSAPYANAEDTAEIYDPETGQFRLAPPPTTSRMASTAVALADGTVLVFGHYGGNITFSHSRSMSAEIFTLTPIEQPVGCCGENPTAITVTTEAGSDPGRVSLVVPPGGLEGATSLGYYYEYETGSGDGEIVGRSEEMLLPEDCSQGCVLVIPEAKGTVRVEIGYESPTPAAASLIAFSVEPGG
ncbi:MAG TPA: kelch repeat-containing protein [Acidimicrobiia bacterium]|nr:kelch repeat-containing protein [Acidimicrobiia bacterium]